MSSYPGTSFYSHIVENDKIPVWGHGDLKSNYIPIIFYLILFFQMIFIHFLSSTLHSVLCLQRIKRGTLSYFYFPREITVLFNSFYNQGNFQLMLDQRSSLRSHSFHSVMHDFTVLFWIKNISLELRNCSVGKLLAALHKELRSDFKTSQKARLSSRCSNHNAGSGGEEIHRLNLV